MSIWMNEKSNETSVPEKEEFYSNLNMEDFTDADYMHAKRIYKEFEIKKNRWISCFVSKTDTQLLADDIENFRKCVLKFII